MRLKLFFFLLCIVGWAGRSGAQTFTISGKLMSSADSLEASGATVRVFGAGDTVLVTGTTTELDGTFEITDLPAGNYLLKYTYLGTKELQRRLHLTDANVNEGTVWLQTNDKVLKGVEVKGTATRMEQLGDTTQFNANAYKTNPDATAEDLVAKMPGITSDNTGVKVNGETVKKILIDGKPFFGTDPTLALKTLPAEVIDQIQVFDQLSDQSQFSGFDDGNTQKTINIRTKSAKSNGQFGKVYAGYGSDDRYSLGGNLNYFNGNRRITLNGISNNINEQNFSSEDLLGVQRGGGGRGDAGNNFMIGKQSGITRTSAIGINYSDAFGSKLKLSGSYFYNNARNNNTTSTERNYFTTNDTALLYRETGTSVSTNENHRLDFRLEYTIDSFNSLIVTPSLSLQQNSTESQVLGRTIFGDNILQSLTQNSSRNKSTGYNFNNSLLYRHKFTKPGRTVSADLGTKLNEKSSDGQLYNLTENFSDTTIRDLQSDLYANGYTLSANISYTEPLSPKSQLMVTYNPSYTKSTSDKQTDSFNVVDHNYSLLDTALSNKYDNTYITQKGGLTYRLNSAKGSFMGGVNVQYASLSGDQFFPVGNHVSRTFTNLLPTLSYNYKFDKGTSLRMMYRTSTQAPSIAQLQDVLDVSNPLFLSSGNADLKQSYTHSLNIRYGATKAQKGKGLFVFANVAYTADYFGTASFIQTGDSVIRGMVLNRGSQYSMPVNLNGYWTARSFATYGMPLALLKSNLNINGGYSYARNPSMINNVANFSATNTFTAGAVLSSNISERVDFTLSYNGNYNIVSNTLPSVAANNYFYHNAAFKINWLVKDRLVINTSLNQSLYSGLGSNFNQQFFLWNAYVGYKFLKDKSLEARISGYDLLKQNRNIARTVTNTYIEDTRTQALTQYFMFTLTYTLRNFKGGANTVPAVSPEDGGPRGNRMGGGDGYRPGGDGAPFGR